MRLVLDLHGVKISVCNVKNTHQERHTWQSVRYFGKTWAIVDVLFGGFWFDCSFFTACPRVVHLTALQAAGVFLCVHDYRAVRTVQVALQTATAVVSTAVAASWLVVGTGGAYAIVEWIPAAI